MRVLASKFKLNTKIHCQSNWKDDKKYQDEMYLWVRKNAFEEVKDVLGLELSLEVDNV